MVFHAKMSGQIRHELLSNSDRTNARAAAPVRYTKGLVQVQMANISANEARAGQPDLCIHIGPIHVDLASMSVNDFTNLHNGGLINSMG